LQIALKDLLESTYAQCGSWFFIKI
jgi:hypothetical protein